MRRQTARGQRHFVTESVLTAERDLYRGLLSLRRTFGVASADKLPEKPERYTAASVFRSMAPPFGVRY